MGDCKGDAIVGGIALDNRNSIILPLAGALIEVGHLQVGFIQRCHIGISVADCHRDRSLEVEVFNQAIAPKGIQFKELVAKLEARRGSRGQCNALSVRQQNAFTDCSRWQLYGHGCSLCVRVDQRGRLIG